MYITNKFNIIYYFFYYKNNDNLFSQVKEKKNLLKKADLNELTEE